MRITVAISTQSRRAAVSRRPGDRNVAERALVTKRSILPIPAIIMSQHACIVAEIAYDPDPIPAGANAATSDKIGQRNLSWAGSDNPGPADTHRVPTFSMSAGPRQRCRRRFCRTN